MKKLIKVLLPLTLMAVLFVGCGGDEEATESPSAAASEAAE